MMSDKINNFFGDLIGTIKSTSNDKEGLSNLQDIIKQKIEDIEKDIEKDPEMNELYNELKKEA